MFKFWRLKRELSKLENACLWLSGGSDSRLLLEVLLSIRAKFSILRFDEGWTRQQSRVVDELTIKHNLRVYAYPPVFASMVGSDGGDLALISGYAVGSLGETTVLVRDIVDGTRCAFDIPMPTGKSISPPIHFENYLVGTKKGETHWALKGRPFLTKKQWKVGGANFHAPLFNFSDADVVKALKRFGVDWVKPSDELDGGNLSSCTKCLHPSENGEVLCPKSNEMIPIVEWKPSENLAAYHKAAGITESQYA